jgi:hypothetical protein
MSREGGEDCPQSLADSALGLQRFFQSLDCKSQLLEVRLHDEASSFDRSDEDPAVTSVRSIAIPSFKMRHTKIIVSGSLAKGELTPRISYLHLVYHIRDEPTSRRIRAYGEELLCQFI